MDDLRKDKENVWLIGVWFFSAADVSAAYPQTRWAVTAFEEFCD